MDLQKNIFKKAQCPFTYRSNPLKGSSQFGKKISVCQSNNKHEFFNLLRTQQILENI